MVGPGSYEVESPRRAQSAKSSVFASKTERFEAFKGLSSPAAVKNRFEDMFDHKYEREHCEDMLYSRKEKRNLSQSVFRSATFRDFDINPKSMYEEVDIRDISKPITPSTIERKSAVEDMQKDGRSYIFKNHNMDRFGNFVGNTRKKPTKTPASPPSYYPSFDRFGGNMAELEKKKHISSSFFVSNTKRDMDVIPTNVPYPGKYDTSQLFATGNQKSFNMNKSGIFL